MLASRSMQAAAQRWSPLVAALGLTAAALFFGGGSGNGSLPWLGGGAILLALVFAATRPLPGGLLPFAPLAALAAWSALSVAWSVEPDRSWAYANRGLVYLAFALVGAFAADRIRELLFGLAAILGAVCAWSLAGKVLPWLYEDYERIARLRAPIGYWNALALLGAIALPIGLCLATRRRVLGTLLVYGWLVAIALTFSRGGVVVAVLVIVAWMVLSRAWPEALATLVAAGVPAAIAIGVGFALAGVTDDGQSHATRVEDGVLFGLALLAGVGAAALAARLPPPEPAAAVRRAALALLAVLAAAAIIVGATQASSWWDSFTSATPAELPNSKGRFAEAGSNYRWLWWKQAWSGWKEHPIAGTGAGSFGFTNLRYRTSSLDQATEPHSLPVQFLTETGIVGLLLFVVAGAGLVGAARRRAGPQLALALALPAYLVHGLIDIDWDFAAVTAPVFLIAGAVAARPAEARRLSPPAVLAFAGVALAVVCSLFAVWLGDRWTGQAYETLDHPAKAVALAKRARSVNPLAVEPLFAQAYAEQFRGNLAEALGLLQQATRLQPENKETWYQLGEFDLRVRHCPRTALPELDRFTQLDPQDPGNKEYDEALKQVNSGKPIC
jgi:tetratricopeptide (TPR) repeat protein